MPSEPVYDEYCPQCGAGRRGPMFTCVECGFKFGRRKSSPPRVAIPGADDEFAEPTPGSWLVSMALIASVPLVALVASFAILGTMQSEVVSAIESSLGIELSAEERARVSISELCSDPLAEGDPFCRDHAIAAAMSPVAVATIAVFLLTIGLIEVARRWVTRNPESLVRVFVPGLYMTQLIVILLMLAVGFLGIAVAYLVPVVLAQIVVPGLIGIIAIAVGVGLIGVIIAVLRVRTRAEMPVIGHDLRRDDEPEFHALVEGVAARVGAEPPDRIVAGVEPTFFVTEADVRTLDGVVPGRTLVVSVPLMRAMTANELRAVIGHEMAHFFGRDTEFSKRFFPVYRAATSSLIAIYATTGNFTRMIVLPPLTVIARFLDAFGGITGSISRERELAADRRGADVTDEASMSSALVSVHRSARAWDGAVDAIADEQRRGAEPSPTVSALLQPDTAMESAERNDLERRTLRHPTDSHPPLSVRLAALGTSLDAVLAADAHVGASSASLLANADAIEQSLTSELRRRIRQALGMIPAGHARPPQPKQSDALSTPAWGAAAEGGVATAVRLYDAFRGEYVGPTFATLEDARAVLRLASERGRDLRTLNRKGLDRLVSDALDRPDDASRPSVEPESAPDGTHRYSGKTLNRCDICGRPASDEAHGQLTIVPI